MRVLLDTHAFLWWLTEPERLSDRSRDVIGDESTAVHVSAVTAYELAYKAERGRLSLPERPGAYVTSRLASNGFDALGLTVLHALRAAELPAIHRDPFDRMLIAQAQSEGIALVTADPAITRYDVETIW
jgi:PIN domain nuclease of toxin-antitoxin system